MAWQVLGKFAQRMKIDESARILEALRASSKVNNADLVKCAGLPESSVLSRVARPEARENVLGYTEVIGVSQTRLPDQILHIGAEADRSTDNGVRRAAYLFFWLAQGVACFFQSTGRSNWAAQR